MMDSMMLPYIHLQFKLRVETAGNLPENKTSMLRGIVARISKRSVCYDLDASCKECELVNMCTYPAIFESAVYTEKLHFGASTPPPYIFRCNDLRTAFTSGDMLTFDILLFGHTTSTFAAHVVEEIRAISQYPFGKDRLICSLYQTSRVDKLYEDTYDQQFLNPSIFQREERHMQQLKIKFVTPLRMLRKGTILRRFELTDFLWQVKHRVTQLTQDSSACLEGLPALPSDSVCVVQEEWRETRRFSNRQQQSIAQNGIVAEIDIQATSMLQEWLLYLQFCEIFHVGKATTFGLGQYELWYK